MQYLQSRGIKVLAVPGITAAAGICAELGVPMTHRGVATAVRFLTGHSREGDEAEATLQEAVAAAADPHTTLVVYMGLGTLPRLRATLEAHGLSVETPAVAVERGTTVDQRVVFSTLGGLEEAVGTAGLRSPTLLIIGKVVALAPGWVEWEAAGRPVGVAGEGECARGVLGDPVAEVLGEVGGSGVGAADMAGVAQAGSSKRQP